MNREIKFRAWDTIEKVMLHNVSTGNIHIWDYSENPSDRVANSKDCIFMQYTGLKDKHGKEIYESDIVYDDEDRQKRTVIFEDGMFCLKRLNGSRYMPSSKHIAVIGNIYEHSHLLNN